MSEQAAANIHNHYSTIFWSTPTIYIESLLPLFRIMRAIRLAWYSQSNNNKF